jgi:hypothetical protein
MTNEEKKELKGKNALIHIQQRYTRLTIIHCERLTVLTANKFLDVIVASIHGH